MGKKKKTLKQKRLADQRLLTESHGETKVGQTQEEAVPQSTTFSYTFSKLAQKTPQTVNFSLQHDLRKTLFVSTGILLFLIIFSTLLHSHAFVLPLVSLRY